MLIKITPGVNFANMFTCSFYGHRSQKCKMINDLTVIFALLGSMYIKSALTTLMKLTPDVNYET